MPEELGGCAPDAIIAKTDGLYSAEEVERIDRILMARHHLGPFEAARLRTDAETLENEAPDTVRFTRALKAATDPEDRAALMQAMWSVALSDGLRDAGHQPMVWHNTTMTTEAGLACAARLLALPPNDRPATPVDLFEPVRTGTLSYLGLIKAKEKKSGPGSAAADHAAAIPPPTAGPHSLLSPCAAPYRPCPR